MVFAALFAGLLLTAGCGKSLQERIEAAKGNAHEEQQAIKQAEEDAQGEYRDELDDFRADAEKQLASQRRDLDELKQKIGSEDLPGIRKLTSQMDLLREKNQDLQSKLDGYKDDGKVNWDAFKRDMTNDLSRIDKTLAEMKQNSH
jgi:chromosome segregation ATPase